MNEWLIPNPFITKQKLLEVLSGIVFLTLLWFSLSRDLGHLTEYPIAVGVDGYYYVLQVSQILRNGHLYFSSATPFILYGLAGLGALIGNSVVAIKIGAVLLQFLLCGSIFALFRSMEYARNFGYFGALLAAYIGLHFNFISEFINNLGAIVLMIWCCACLITVARNASVTLLVACVFLVIAAAFSHRSVLPTILVLGVLATVTYQLLHADRSFVVKAFCFFLLVLIFLSPALVESQQIIEVPPWLKDEVLFQPRLPFGPVAFSEKLILLIAAPLTLFFVYRLPKQIRKGTKSYIASIIAVWSLLITLNPFLNYGRGWDGIATRLCSLSYIQVAILLPSLMWLWMYFDRKAYLYVMALFAPLLVLSLSAHLPSGMQSSYLYNRAQIIEQLPKQVTRFTPGSLIIAEQGTQFVVTFATGFQAQKLLTAKPDGADIYWVLFGIKPEMRGEAMTTLAIGEHGTFTILIRHDELQRYLSSLSYSDRRYLFLINSHLYQSCIKADLETSPGECFQLP